MADSGVSSQDRWSGQAYAASADFVPKLTSTVLSYLDPKPSDHILDLGCGDGVLTAQIAQHAGSVVGLDSSPAMIETAQSKHGRTKNCQFKVVDCRYLEDQYPASTQGRFDKVFSNAALHWILRPPSTRSSIFRSVRSALKPGGLFVFEMGGHGNVAEAHTALRAALVHQGLSVEQVEDTCPWFFPSEAWIKDVLRRAHFEPLRVETEWRPTRLTSHDQGGLEGWVRLMGASFLDALETIEKREKAVQEVCQVLQGVCSRDDDNASMWLNYVRLRGVARAI